MNFFNDLLGGLLKMFSNEDQKPITPPANPQPVKPIISPAKPVIKSAKPLIERSGKHIKKK